MFKVDWWRGFLFVGIVGGLDEGHITLLDVRPGLFVLRAVVFGFEVGNAWRLSCRVFTVLHERIRGWSLTIDLLGLTILFYCLSTAVAVLNVLSSCYSTMAGISVDSHVFTDAFVSQL